MLNNLSFNSHSMQFFMQSDPIFFFSELQHVEYVFPSFFKPLILCVNYLVDLTIVYSSSLKTFLINSHSYDQIL